MRFDSKFEQRLYRGVLKDCKYHTGGIGYIVNEHRNYYPDFIYKNFIIESKGRFRTSAEAKKYLHIRKALAKGKELVFIFMKRNTYFPGARPRKDGTRRTQEEWCEKHGFRYFYEDTVGSIVK